MGYVAHHAIVATTYAIKNARDLAKFARSVGAEALTGKERVNGYVSVCITPDGSKEGWNSSSDGDVARSKIIEWMRTEDQYEWVEVRYGDDDGRARIERDAWERNP